MAKSAAETPLCSKNPKTVFLSKEEKTLIWVLAFTVPLQCQCLGGRLRESTASNRSRWIACVQRPLPRFRGREHKYRHRGTGPGQCRTGRRDGRLRLLLRLRSGLPGRILAGRQLEGAWTGTWRRGKRDDHRRRRLVLRIPRGGRRTFGRTNRYDRRATVVVVVLLRMLFECIKNLRSEILFENCIEIIFFQK